MLKKIGKNITLEDSDIATLAKYGIEATKYQTIRELQLAIEQYEDSEDLEDSELDELDYIASSLQETQYYQYTNK